MLHNTNFPCTYEHGKERTYVLYSFLAIRDILYASREQIISHLMLQNAARPLCIGGDWLKTHFLECFYNIVQTDLGHCLFLYISKTYSMVKQ